MLLRQWLKKRINKKLTETTGGAIIIFMRDTRDLFAIAEEINDAIGGVLWSDKCDEAILTGDDVGIFVSVLTDRSR